MAASKVVFFIAWLIVESFAQMNFDEMSFDEMKKGMDPEKIVEMFNCLEHIVCDLDYVPRPEMEEAGPKLLEKMFEWHGNCFDMKSEGKEEFFRDFTKDLCPKTEQHKRNCMKETVMQYETHMEVICGTEPDEEECERGKKFATSFAKTIQEYMTRGECQDTEEMGKTMPKVGKFGK